MRVLVTGGCGYKGSVLVPKLLEQGHEVIVVDTQWFGNYLAPSQRLTTLKVDIRELESVPLEGVDAIIHLASVANDPCSELNPKLSWEVGALATMQLADAAVRSGVRQFIYASSGSVYGIKHEEKVTEELTLSPISDYNKTKMVAERVLLSYRDKMRVQIVRPATVCGYSPRMRLDVAVNMLTMQALTKGAITVLGGSQIRPNIHMQDVTDLYIFFLEEGRSLEGTFNAGFENLSILEIAQRVVQAVPARIEVAESNDPRSYRLDSGKLLAAGFRPKKSVSDAIAEIVEMYRSKRLADEDRFYNLRWMKREMAAILA